MDRDLNMADTHTHVKTDMYPRAYGLTSLPEKTRNSNHMQMLEERQQLLLDYFKTLSVGSAGNKNQATPTVDWHLTN